jgi:hypothetical protein
MSEQHIEVAYDGEALRTGSIGVRDLAPATLAIGNLCQEANRGAGAGALVLSSFMAGWVREDEAWKLVAWHQAPFGGTTILP